MVTDNIISNNGAFEWGGGLYLCCSQAPTIVANNWFSGNWVNPEGGGFGAGICVHDEPPLTIISNNRFMGNVVHGIYSRFEQPINAVNNWWGAIDGPGGTGPGSGDWVNHGVAYDPWMELLLAAADTATVAGAGVEVPLSFENEVNVCELSFTVQFDVAELGTPTFVSSPRMAGMSVNALPVPGGLAFTATGPPPGIVAGSGDILTLLFDLPQTGRPDEYSIGLVDVTANDCSQDERSVLSEGGILEVRHRFREDWEFCSGHAVGVAWGDVGEPGMWGGGPDGDLDLALGNTGGEQNRLLWQPLAAIPGDFPFMASDQFGSGNTYGMAWGDCDNDGDLDLGLGNGNNQLNAVYCSADTGFVPGTLSGVVAPDDTRGVAWADYDGDSDLDLAVANLGQNYIYRNDTTWTFTPVAMLGSDNTQCLVWCDFDGDGDPDVAAGNDGQNRLYVNQLAETGSPDFIARNEFGTGTTRGMIWFDYDNDQDFDLALTNAGDLESNRLYTNQLTETGMADFDNGQDMFGTGMSYGITRGDYDSDGDLDVLVTRTQSQTNGLYLNEPDSEPRFVEIPEFATTGYSAGCATGDYDNDGDLDLAIANTLAGPMDPSPGHSIAFNNQMSSNGWLKVRLRGGGIEGYSNRDGIGAVVQVYRHGAETPIASRWISAGNGYCSMDDIKTHFGGLGNESYDIEVLWPSGSSSILWDILANAAYLMVEGCADMNGDGTGPDIADLVYLVTYMFQGGPAPPIVEAADVNGDGTGPDIADLVYLVTYMFQGGPAPVCHQEI